VRSINQYGFETPFIPPFKFIFILMAWWRVEFLHDPDEALHETVLNFDVTGEREHDRRNVSNLAG